MGRCDKCGRKVDTANDAVQLDVYAGYLDPLMAVFAQSRHLLPVYEDGVRVCDGSPSRAQYLEGQPRDTRGLWNYDAVYVERIRDAYERMQREAA